MREERWRRYLLEEGVDEMERWIRDALSQGVRVVQGNVDNRNPQRGGGGYGNLDLTDSN